MGEAIKQVHFENDRFKVTLRQVPPTSEQSAHSSIKLVRLGDEHGTPTSWHEVEASDGDGVSCRCLLTATGGASGVHENSAVIVDDQCFVAVGPFVICLALPDLGMRWTLQADEATCFGIYYSPDHHCLISHGEMSIARLSLTGQHLWKAFGADIFTGPCLLQQNLVVAVDFYNQVYRFDIETGQEVIN